jgi:CDP-4-dehydro-6-deoxyglucose reductase, E1
LAEKAMPTNRNEVLELVDLIYKREQMPKKFTPGVTRVPVTGKVFDQSEITAAVNASLDFWLTAGPNTEEFERKLARRVGVRHALMCNSGSSANLLAVATLTSNKLGDRALKPGDEVVTLATAFPTTVSPLIQYGLIPVFVDLSLGDYSPIVDQIESALSSKTKAIMLAHTLGNPFDISAIKAIADKHNLWLIEDNCDALGGTYKNQQLGSFGDMATQSFYPAHHITTGEGGAVLTKHAKLKPIIESFRDWGRDCWCQTGCDNTCLKRFEWNFEGMPAGYDHKYTYSHIGYNLKSGDIQAAIGLAQLEKLDKFVATRRKNWEFLSLKLADLEDQIILPKPTPDSDPSWFGFAITLRNGSRKTRTEVLQKLEDLKIDTRLMFAGNLLRQPGFKDIEHRKISALTNSNKVMEDTFWVGVWPGLTTEMLEYASSSIISAVLGQK